MIKLLSSGQCQNIDSCLKNKASKKPLHGALDSSMQYKFSEMWKHMGILHYHTSSMQLTLMTVNSRECDTKTLFVGPQDGTLHLPKCCYHWHEILRRIIVGFQKFCIQTTHNIRADIFARQQFLILAPLNT